MRSAAGFHNYSRVEPKLRERERRGVKQCLMALTRRPSGVKLPLESYKSVFEGAMNTAGEKHAIEQAGDPPARLVLHDEAIHESVAVGLEVALVVRVGHGGFALGPLLLQPERTSRLLTPSQPSTLCGRPLDWLEALAR